MAALSAGRTIWRRPALHNLLMGIAVVSMFIAVMAALLLALSGSPSGAEGPTESTTMPTSEAPQELQPPGTSTPASAEVLDASTVETVLGREVRSVADENMGRIVDVIVDLSGQVRAAAD
jgi:hypothetical protein